MGFYSAHTCSDRVSCGTAPCAPTPHPAALQQHGVNPNLGWTAVCPCLVWLVCILLAGGRCVSASAHHRDIAHRDLLSTELGCWCVGGAAWVRCAHAAGPVSSPPTLHTRPASTHQPHTRDCQEIWRSVEVGLSSNYAAAVITRDCCLVDVLHCVTRVLAEYGQ